MCDYIYYCNCTVYTVCLTLPCLSRTFFNLKGRALVWQSLGHQIASGLQVVPRVSPRPHIQTGTIFHKVTKAINHRHVKALR